MSQIFKCNQCNEYTLTEVQCPKCGGTVVSPRPPKYSPEDKYGMYRRKAKKKAREASSE
ncbi:MAG: RNA-protein complex protein Nop10 [Candidatus Thorarchaeota archaeon]